MTGDQHSYLDRLFQATRGLQIPDSLEVLGRIDRFRHFGTRVQIPGFPNPPKYELMNCPFGFPWARDLVAESIIINGDYFSRVSLSDYNRFSAAIRAATDYCLSSPFDFDQVSIWRYMGSLLYQQIPDQRPVGFDDIMLFYKIYDYPKIRESFKEEFDVELESYFQHVFIIYSLFQNSTFIKLPLTLKKIRFNAHTLHKIFQKISMPVELHREFSKANRLAGHHQKFHLSSFVSNPIAVIDINRPELCCPFVGHLLRRLTYGVYYDLIKLDGFANNVGYAFEECVGNIIKLLSPNKWNIYSESVSGKKEPKSSSDWLIVEDDIGVFIECKFKRPLVDTKSDPSNEGAFERDLFHYAKFCAQAIMAAEREHAGMFDRDVPKGAVYIIIVTPEDWLILNGVIGAEIRKMCTEELRRKGSDPNLVEKYSIINMGCSSFSLFVQAAAHFSLTEVLVSHSSDKHLNDFTPGFVMNSYGGRGGFRPQKLWREDFDKLIDLDQFRPEKI